MRKSNMKAKLIVALAFVLGFLAATFVVFTFRAELGSFAGLAFFGTLMLVSSITVVILVRVFKIGRN